MYLCIDIGGTKTLLALFSRRGRLLKKFKFPTDKEPHKFMCYLGDHLSSFMLGRDPRKVIAIIIAYPGIIVNNQPIKAPNLPLWAGMDFDAEFRHCTNNLFNSHRGKLPIFYNNDANLGAFYECFNKPGKSVYLAFGTGIGGGIMKDNKLMKESAGFEPGHKKYNFNGKTLEWEDIAASSAVRKAHDDIDVTKIKKREMLDDVALRISLGLIDIIKEVKPDNIIIGGPLSEVFKGFRKQLTGILQETLGGEVILPKITSAKKPQEAVVYGCYLYGKEHTLETGGRRGRA